MSLILSDSKKRKASELNSSDSSNLFSVDGCWYLLLSFQMKLQDFNKNYNMKQPLKDSCFETTYLDIFKTKLDDLKSEMTTTERSKLFFWLFSSKEEVYDFVANCKKTIRWADIFEILPLIDLSMTQEESEYLLENAPPYSFVIRLSNTYAHCFVVSFIHGKNVQHRRFVIRKYYLLYWAIMSTGSVKGRAFPRNGDSAKHIVMEVCKYAAAGCDEEEMGKTYCLNENANF